MGACTSESCPNLFLGLRSVRHRGSAESRVGWCTAIQGPMPQYAAYLVIPMAAREGSDYTKKGLGNGFAHRK